MEVRDFTSEEVPRAIAKWIEDYIICDAYDFVDVINMLRNGKWLEYFKEAENSWK